MPVTMTRRIRSVSSGVSRVVSKKPECFGFKHEVVARSRPQRPGHAPARRRARRAVRDRLAEVRPPLPEVVIDVNRGDAAGGGAAFQH
jgi:hypothetical protein